MHCVDAVRSVISKSQVSISPTVCVHGCRLVLGVNNCHVEGVWVFSSLWMKYQFWDVTL
jgi:hypothetical protein